MSSIFRLCIINILYSFQDFISKNSKNFDYLTSVLQKKNLLKSWLSRSGTIMSQAINFVSLNFNPQYFYCYRHFHHSSFWLFHFYLSSYVYKSSVYLNTKEERLLRWLAFFHYNKLVIFMEKRFIWARDSNSFVVDREVFELNICASLEHAW